MGNPCIEWEGCRAYIAATLPQLAQLDGKEITRSERILAQQSWRGLRNELRSLADAKRVEAGLPPAPRPPPEEGEEDLEPWCPETRVKMYREMAEQKAEVEKNKSANAPKKRDQESEHEAAVRRTRDRERVWKGGEGAAEASTAASEDLPRQTNEGRWEFVLEDEDGCGNCVLRLQLSRFLDSSLVDVDVHPRYVSVVVKNKVFRILWPEEVLSSRGNCQRSSTTGELCVTAPKAHTPTRAQLECARKAREEETKKWDGVKGRASGPRRGVKGGAGGVAGQTSEGGKNAVRSSTSTLAEELAAAAAAVATVGKGDDASGSLSSLNSGKAVNLERMVRGGKVGAKNETGYVGDGALLREAETVRTSKIDASPNNLEAVRQSVISDSDCPDLEDVLLLHPSHNSSHVKKLPLVTSLDEVE